ncbi:MAG: pyridoxal 5'-phosphate synthase glutaminase subunit PdxT, partial [Thermoleophilia bacterium]|nr:pyridoxal 5'-phosphate synthase glutaminase subunit PdxT [Thermoleophilia bacterium]
MSAEHEKHIIGILALQGAFREHAAAIELCGATARKVRRRRDLAGIDALIIPGGESTTIGKLMVSYHLLDEIRGLGAARLPIFGTCAGMVMLASEVVEGDQPLLGIMDITVRRNAFGRQVKSFEADLDIPALAEASAEPFHGIFIRAPWIESVGEGVEILAEHGGHAVAAREGNMLVTAFHPELT